MELVVGKEYYWLSNTDHEFIHELYNGCTFVQGPDGFWYAEIESVGEDFYDLLLENDLAQTTYYSKSTQPGGGM